MMMAIILVMMMMFIATTTLRRNDSDDEGGIGDGHVDVNFVVIVDDDHDDHDDDYFNNGDDENYDYNKDHDDSDEYHICITSTQKYEWFCGGNRTFLAPLTRVAGWTKALTVDRIALGAMSTVALVKTVGAKETAWTICRGKQRHRPKRLSFRSGSLKSVFQ